MFEYKGANRRNKLPPKSTEMMSWLTFTGMLPAENERSDITVIQHASAVCSKCLSMLFPVDIFYVLPASNRMATKYAAVARLSR